MLCKIPQQVGHHLGAHTLSAWVDGWLLLLLDMWCAYHMLLYARTYLEYMLLMNAQCAEALEYVLWVLRLRCAPPPPGCGAHHVRGIPTHTHTPVVCPVDTAMGCVHSQVEQSLFLYAAVMMFPQALWWVQLMLLDVV